MKKCVEKIWSAGSFRPVGCSRNAVKDGFCKQHHPDTVRERRAKRDAAADEKVRKMRETGPYATIQKYKSQRDELLAALKRMQALHDLMMKQANHGASFYQADCLREMNEAPIQAARAIAKVEAE
jgi:uncharacterized coiled-coil DUF342 family protein